ncbi:hypothetical protein [Actinomadura fibrosa]|uniref:Uncharacterized protein n=1 Tax=Actinomadura fibrosa TaxID=111802 RepID=A0ABW2XCZ2_9ACTN|nr:hypothetical protein [Actinomadura fibrosa]
MPDAVTNVHPAARLALPEGGFADVDLKMVPLVQALWAMGLRTAGCCQDLGESSAFTGNEAGRERFGQYYRGQAWLKMPVEDTRIMLARLAEHPRFRERFNRWTRPDAWENYVYLLAGDTDVQLSAWAQIHFPNDQLDEVTAILGGPASTNISVRSRC